MSILTERDTGRQTDAFDFRYFRLKTMQGNWFFYGMIITVFHFDLIYSVKTENLKKND